MSEKSAEKKASGRRKSDAAAFSSADTVNAEPDTSKIAGREMPRNLDAEEGVLASVLRDGTGDVINTCAASKVREEYFFEPRHRVIYSAMLALYTEGKVVDAITLAEYLNSRGRLDYVGGIENINRIAGRIETSASYPQWIAIIKEKFFLRTIISVCMDTIQAAYSNMGSVDSFMEAAEERFLGISQDRIGDTLKPASQQVEVALKNINQMIMLKGEPTGIETGFTGLDSAMRGLHSNEMIVIAGRPGTGKTSIALNIVEHAVLYKKPANTLIFSLEMLAEQLLQRMIAARARVDQYKISQGRISADDLRAITEAAGELSRAPISIDDTSNMTILEMRAKARRLDQKLRAENKKLDLIVIDYLQLVKGGGSFSSREQEVADISRGIKAMAKELRVPVIVLAQLNRESEKGEKRNPLVSDLRESGSIEQDADAVILLSVQRKKDATDEELNANQNWLIRVDLAKQRNGPTRVVNLLFNRGYTRYENFTDREDVQF